MSESIQTGCAMLPTLLVQICCQAPFTPQWWRSVLLRPDSQSVLKNFWPCFLYLHADPLVLTLSQTGRRYAAPLLRGHCTGLQCVQYAWVTLTPSLIHVCEHCKNRQYAEDWETLPHPSSSRGKSRVRGSASGLASVAGFVSGGEMGNVFTQRCWVE